MPPLARCCGFRRKPFAVWLLRRFGAISGETQGGRNNKWTCFAPTCNARIVPCYVSRSWTGVRYIVGKGASSCGTDARRGGSLTRLSQTPHNDITESLHSAANEQPLSGKTSSSLSVVRTSPSTEKSKDT